MDARCGGLAVAAATVTVRRPLQPRDTNVAPPSTAVVGKAPKPNTMAKARERAALPPLSAKLRLRADCSRVAVGTAEVSLAEELEKARERRGRLLAARERTERALDERAEALDREAAEWERREEEQRRLVAELMRLIGMPEVYTPVESLRSREERKRREASAHSGSRGSTSTASTLQVDSATDYCDQDSMARAETVETAKAIESCC
ncbi:hypothetical protein ACP70R_035161 [Stipagrostis hirtigluma subsp. patula]